MSNIAKCLIAAIVASILLIAYEANAQHEDCAARDAYAKHLDRKFKEVIIAAGIAANGSVVELFSNHDGTTWTILLTKPNGVACLKASGEDWLDMTKPKKKEVY